MTAISKAERMGSSATPTAASIASFSAFGTFGHSGRLLSPDRSSAICRSAWLRSATIAGRSRIEREYLASDQRRFFVPCPACGEMQWLRFERLLWEKGSPETARYHCDVCDHPMAALTTRTTS
jgi:phage terminase large subunit GpA-like protein